MCTLIIKAKSRCRLSAEGSMRCMSCTSLPLSPVSACPRDRVRGSAALLTSRLKLTSTALADVVPSASAQESADSGMTQVTQADLARCWRQAESRSTAAAPALLVRRLSFLRLGRRVRIAAHIPCMLPFPEVGRGQHELA